MATQQTAFPPLPSCKDLTLKPPVTCPGPQEALNDALNALRSKLAPNSCPSCFDSVFNKLGSRYTQDGLLKILSREPRFYDGTKSTLKLTGLCGRAGGILAFIDYLLCGGPPLPAECKPPSVTVQVTTVSQFLACSRGSAVTETPTQSNQGLMTFFDPTKVYLVPSTTNTGIVNQALLFHEGLHGYTGLYDSSLLEDFGYNAFNDPSCKITGYLELAIWGGTIPTCGN